jgi:hypothetical protein
MNIGQQSRATAALPAEAHVPPTQHCVSSRSLSDHGCAEVIEQPIKATTLAIRSGSSRRGCRYSSNTAALIALSRIMHLV